MKINVKHKKILIIISEIKKYEGTGGVLPWEGKSLIDFFTLEYKLYRYIRGKPRYEVLSLEYIMYRYIRGKPRY